jgi:iron(III) transport system permease protein
VTAADLVNLLYVAPPVRKWRPALHGTAIALGVVLWAFVVGPMLATLQRSVDVPDGVWTAYRDFIDFRSGVVPRSALGSVVVSLLSVLTAGIVGTALAVMLERWEFPLRRAFRVLILVPLALPPFMGVAAFAKLYGLGGVVPALLGRIFGFDPNAFAVSGMAGVLLVHTVGMYPYFYLPVAAALRQSDDALEDAARSLGASAAQTWRRVLLPMLTPAITAGALLTFMASMGSYTAPVIFGMNQVLTRQIVLAHERGDLAFASAASVVLALSSIGFLVLFRSYERRSSYWPTSKGGASIRSRRVRPVWRGVLCATASATTAFAMLPMAMILVLAFSVDGTWRQSLLPTEYGTQNLVRLAGDRRAWEPVVNSLQMSAIATVGATIAGLCGAWLAQRTRLRGRALLEIAMMLPWALPGTVVAFNLIAAFNQPSPFAFGHTLVGTYAIVPLAYFVRFSPLVFRSTAASLAQIDPALEDAARSLGASAGVAFRRVVLPLLSRGIAAGALLVFVGGIGEFVATTLLHTQQRYKPLSMAIAEQFYRGDIGLAATWGAIEMFLVLGVLVAARRLGPVDRGAGPGSTNRGSADARWFRKIRSPRLSVSAVGDCGAVRS